MERSRRHRPRIYTRRVPDLLETSSCHYIFVRPQRGARPADDDDDEAMTKRLLIISSASNQSTARAPLFDSAIHVDARSLGDEKRVPT
jgi:hypothetical protein